jgi:hypothetical protein
MLQTTCGLLVSGILPATLENTRSLGDRVFI